MVITANYGTTIEVNGQEYVYFGGTNYLSLAQRPELLQAATQAFEQYGFSASASRLTSGQTDSLLALESQLAAFGQAEAALALPAGYVSNQAVVDGLDESVDAWVIQRQAHGSIKSAVASSRKEIFEYDFHALQSPPPLRTLFGIKANKRLGVFAEPVDPLTGQVYNIRALAQAAEGDDYLVLDEAHSFGVFGSNGRGALEYFSLKDTPPRLVRTGTFSKAIGTSGGFVLAQKEVIDAIKMRSGTYKVSTPSPPPVVAATAAALTLLERDPATTIAALHNNISFTNKQLSDAGFGDFAENACPIYYVRNLPRVPQLSNQLQAEGFYLPTVTSYFADFCDLGLRWTVHAAHSKNEIERLVQSIVRIVA